MNHRKIFGVMLTAFFLGVAFLAGGCAQKTGSAQQANMADWEYVPRIWVEDNSFLTGQYDRCSFDEESGWYLCPPGTK
jgi:hypothetical protein